MRIFSLLFAGAFGLNALCCSSIHAREDAPHQPYASYWFVDELLKWDPDKDPHAPFNISKTPLAERFVHRATQRNPEQSSEPQVMALMSTHPTSNNPSQAFRQNDQYVFPFWQYLDVLVMWGGSSGEGLILAPPVPWIDAAHRNGVKVFGTIFFPPKVYGGKIEWVRELLVQDSSGGFPVADKLLEVADLYGFDGWFLNQETEGATPEEAQAMQDFLTYYQEHSAGRFQMIWYDSMLADGKIAWQEELNELNKMFFQQGKQQRSDMIFLDFGWNAEKLQNTARVAKKLDRKPWEAYAGIDVQSHSYRTPTDWKALYENGKPAHTSIALYWPTSTANIADEKTLSAIYSEDAKFWNGTTVESPKYGKREWKGFANYFPARSVINQFPFLTRFNYGAGDFYNEAGRRVSDRPWHHMSAQDLLPTWQWRADPAKLHPMIDHEDAYHGGSCLRIDANLGASESATLPLYKVKLKASTATTASVVAKVRSPHLKVSLTITLEGTEAEQLFFPLELKGNGEWETQDLNLQSLAGSTMATIGLKIAASERANSESVRIGQILLRDGPREHPKPPKITVQPFLEGEKAELYVSFLDTKDASLACYNLYQFDSQQRRQWLGLSTKSRAYIPEFLLDEEGDGQLMVVAESKEGEVSQPTIVRISSHDN